MPENPPKNQPPTPPADPNADWTAAEKKWFDDNGITNEDEKEAIRGRARVAAYDRFKVKFDEEKDKGKKPDNGGKPKKPWFTK